MVSPPARSRHGRRRFARAAARGAAAAAALCLVLAFAFGSTTARLLDRADRGFHGALRTRLASGHGLVLYAPLDAGVPVNEASGAPLEGAGTRVVPGWRGEARRFGGDGDAFLETDVRWSRFGNSGGTLFFRADLEDAAVERRIVWDHDSKAETGIRLLPGRTLEAVFSDGGGRHVLSAPFPPSGRFVPVAFVFGRDRAALWVDGREAASAPVEGDLLLPYHRISFGNPRLPFAGAVDEASAWTRPLPASELSVLSASRRSPCERLEPLRARLAAAAGSLSRGFRTAARVLDRLVPSSGGPAVLRQDVPELDLVLSKRDERRFLVAHERSLQSGFRLPAAASGRSVSVRWKGSVCDALLSLDDAYGPPSPERPAPARRPSFLLRGAPGVFAPGSGTVRLVPPERHGDVRPDAPRALPPARTLVRLFLDGGFRGLYVLEPFDMEGGAWRASGERAGLRPDHLFFASAPAGGPPDADGERAWRETLSLLRSDPRFPWSGSEARWRDRLHAKRRESLFFAPPSLSALDLKGNNPSPFYVTNDVDLTAAGPGVSWRSSGPATLDVDGTVCTACCDGDLPRVVELTGTFPDGSERTFRFRVMPESPRLPALFLHFPDPLRKNRRTDFTAARIPAGGGAAEFLSGTAATGGGAKHRGNTSYARGARRSLSLEFDRPVGWSGASAPAEHVLLLSGYSDATRLRNALSFDAFAAMHPDAPRGAVPVSWTEAFVNGEWAGVWETVPRLKDEVSSWASPIYKVRSFGALWSSVSAETLDRRDAAPDGTDPYGPFLELAKFVAESSDAEFAARAGGTFDLDELADMMLLLDFTGNMDGRVTNQYVVRRRSDGRWLVLPWDYDKTFLPDKAGGRISNFLYKRCLSCVPGFAGRLADRWAALRAGPLSDAALDAWIDGKAAFLAPFMDEDYRLVPPAGTDGNYMRNVEILREQVRLRARRLDERL